MKTRNQKVICILASVFLLASFFAIPVSAEDYNTVVFNFPGDGAEFNSNYFGFVRRTTSLDTTLWNSFRRPTSGYFGKYTLDSSTSFWVKTYYFDWPSDYGNQGYTSFYLGSSSFNRDVYSLDDTVWIDGFNFYVMLGQSYTAFRRYRFCFRNISSGNVIGNVVGYSDWQNFSFITTEVDAVRKISSPSLFLDITKAGAYDGLAFFIEFDCYSQGSAFSIGLEQTGITVNYGHGSNPNYPIYNAPTPGDEIIVDSYVTQEEALINGNQSNLNNSVSQFSAVPNIMGGLFSVGVVTVTNVMAKFMNLGNGNFLALVNLSLALGLFATLLGLAASIVGGADRRAARAARSSKRGR